MVVFVGPATAETQIEDVNDLQNVSDDLSGEYVLANDIDASSIENFEPIGGTDNGFNGTFDGEGHRIDGLSIDSESSQRSGLFIATTDEAEILNLTLTNVTVLNSEGVAAGLVALHQGTIVGSNVTGEIVGEGGTGGLVGTNKGDIRTSHTAGNVSGDESGGLIGIAYTGEVIRSGSSADVTAEFGAGGLVGSNFGADVTGSHATGEVTAERFGAGGFVANNADGNISRSYATGDVSGERVVGGLVGTNSADSYEQNDEGVQPAPGFTRVDNGTITESYATGNVSGEVTVGGVAGGNSGSLRSSYATGRVSGEERVGGLVGLNSGEVEESYTAGTVTGNKSVGALVGRMRERDGDGYGNVLRSSYWLGGVGQSDIVGRFAAGQSTGAEEDTERIEGNRCLSSEEMRGDSAVDAMPEFDFTTTWVAGTGPDGYPGLAWHSDNSDIHADATGGDDCPNEFRDTDGAPPLSGFTLGVAVLSFVVGLVMASRRGDS